MPTRACARLRFVFANSISIIVDMSDGERERTRIDAGEAILANLI
jgi:hypothetical protein